MIVRLFLWFILVLAFTTSCKNPSYFRNSNPVVKANYNNDSLLLKDYVYCGGFYRVSFSLIDRKNSRVLDRSINFDDMMCPDSLYLVFAAALNKLELPISIIEDPTRHCDSIYSHYYKNDFRKFRADRVADLFGNTQGRTVIVPVIFFENVYINEASGNIFRGEALGFGSYYNKFTKINLLIIIGRDDEVLYSRTSFFMSKNYDSVDKYDLAMPVEQHHWDELVAHVMQDYIKRVQ